ncbi:FAD-binding protein [Alkalihalobacillus oceani]|uniref:FAD-binding protein n=1 Tax=Halalkalibacter oceani TaxID=1653776 RepID=A0A9X2DT11_9BACI|nr:FAD-binding protein [Halalkalibacter oceani]MCM3715908.1 FAD-binding protein [Halalkalibacter oceani]
MYSTDVLVVGSEASGAQAAIAAAEAGAYVTVVTKGKVNMSGATLTASADINVDSKTAKELGLPGDSGDSEEQFFTDTVIGGKYLNNQKLVESIVRKIPTVLKGLMDDGLKAESLIHTPGHEYPRGVIVNGLKLTRKLAQKMRKHDRVTIMEQIMVLEILKKDGKACGIYGYDLANGMFITIRAKAVVLATGGGMAAFPIRTAPDELTGDGYMMAWRAGAELIDMEMPQFMPGVLINPPAWRGNQFIYEISFGSKHGLEGWLLNKSGIRFMKDWDPERMEKSTRDKLSIAIMNEVVEGRGTPDGGVYYSTAHLPKNLIRRFADWYPFVTSDWTYEKLNFNDLMEELLRDNAVEIGVGCHFFMGGIRINVDGETSVPGLYGAGEATGGFNGANRISGNALTETLVQGGVSGAAAAAYAKEHELLEIETAQLDALHEKQQAYLKRQDGMNPYELRQELAKLSWNNIGVVRTTENLQSVIKELRTIREEKLPQLVTKDKTLHYNRELLECMQLENVVSLLEAIALSALERKESRGAHYLKDIPESREDQLKNIIVQNINGEMKIKDVPLVVTSIQPN